MNICVYPRLFGGHAVSELQSKNLKEPLNILWNLKPLKNWSLSLYILILLIHLRYVLYISLYTVPHFSFFYILFFVTILYLILYFWRGIFHSHQMLIGTWNHPHFNLIILNRSREKCITSRAFRTDKANYRAASPLNIFYATKKNTGLKILREYICQ